MAYEPIDDDELAGIFAGLDAFGRLGLAVSGGVDSVALMHLAVRWRTLSGLSRPEFVVLTVDHGLRPDSGDEAAWVARQADLLGLAHETLCWRGRKPESAIQETARSARYRLLAGAARDNALQAILTGHHLDDQGETVLMRLARAAGVDGLSAMAGETWLNGVIIRRPFLAIAKGRLEANLRVMGVRWIEDPSNADPAFERVRLRRAGGLLADLGLVPEHLALTARRMQRARAALEHQTTQYLLGEASLKDCLAVAGFARLSLERLVGEPEEIRLRALARLIDAVGGGRSPRLTKLEKLLEHIARAGPADGGWTLGGCQLARVDGALEITRESGRCGLDTITLRPGQTTCWDGRFEVGLAPDASGPLDVGPLSASGRAELRAHIPPGVPLRAAETVPCFRLDGDILALPQFGYITTTGGKTNPLATACRSRFANPALSAISRTP